MLSKDPLDTEVVGPSVSPEQVEKDGSASSKKMVVIAVIVAVVVAVIIFALKR